jgi:integrase
MRRRTVPKMSSCESPEKRKPELRFKEPKTPGSRRSIPLPQFAVERLRQHRREQKDRFDTLGLWRTNDSLVFDHAGEPWNPNTFGTEFVRRVSCMKLPPVRLHDLRHSYASLMLESGVDLKTVSQALGHSTIRITADTLCPRDAGHAALRGRAVRPYDRRREGL